jgi:hypothetical protein
MASITWASSTTSSNPPQEFSDVFSLTGTATFAAQLTAHALGGDVNLIGTLNLQASPDGISYVTVASNSVNIPAPLTHTYSFGPVATGLYQYARIDWEVEAGPHNDGFFDTGTWTVTIAVQQMELLGGAPWWIEGPAPIPPLHTLNFIMRGYVTALPGYVYWHVTNRADPDGLFSGYSPVPSDIVIETIYETP